MKNADITLSPKTQFGHVLKHEDPKSDEYVDPGDNLIHCRECREPREKILDVFGKDNPIIVPSPCRCQRMKREQEGKEQEEKDRQLRIQKLRSFGVPIRFREYTFEKNQDMFDSDKINILKNYVSHIADMEKNGEGLLLTGPPRSGKAILGACVINALIDMEISAFMRIYPLLPTNVESLESKARSEFIDNLINCSVLMIAEFGAEQGSEYAKSILYSIIKARYMNKKPLIITTHYTLEELRNPSQEKDISTFNQILECCAPITIPASNISIAEADRNFRRAKEILT